MGSSYEQLLDDFLEAWNADYRTDPERDAKRMEALAWTVQAILEKLRDAERERP